MALIVTAIRRCQQESAVGGPSAGFSSGGCRAVSHRDEPSDSPPCEMGDVEPDATLAGHAKSIFASIEMLVLALEHISK